MSDATRRMFLQTTAAVGAGLALMKTEALAQTRAAAPPVVDVSWLGGEAPVVPAGVSFGVPWPRGSLAKGRTVGLRSAAGPVATQSWPMAYWPDGSVKWTGIALAADAKVTGPLSVSAGATVPAPSAPVRVQNGAGFVEVTTGPLRCRIPKSGQNLIDTLAVEGRDVARNGRLIVLREDRSAYAASRTIREEEFISRVTGVTVEQSGPVRAVVRIDGTHAAAAAGGRQWLPFSVRLYFTAGLESVRMVHTFVFDGDQSKDFIRGIGLSFAVPFREEIQNRHIRFATDNAGIFAEPVLMAPGYRPSAVRNGVELQRAQLQGKRIPNKAEYTPQEQTNWDTIAIWDSFKLGQLGPDSFTIHKRTNPDSAWLQITGGNRARGLVYLGDVSGGLAVGVKRFWQKHPSSFEVLNGSKPAGELKVWFWSPEAPAMDVRHYDTIGHAQSVSYEDYEEGHADAIGAANTSELTLWATPGTPDRETFDRMANAAINPPLLICTPQHYYNTRTLGVWSLPGQATPGLTAAEVASAETQLDRAFKFFEGEIDRRKWYGFWDFGDVKRTYDPVRHEWMYDIGGHGWNATELMPEAWLWMAFLRSGRADIFRMAENMTRATTEVAVHHIGEFAGLGSRHNVSHWGDGAKESRINQAFLKRFYYYLTTDERMGDLIREPLAVMENAIVTIPPLRKVVPRPDIKPPYAFLRIGPDWFALASNWMAEWERTGDVRYRDYILTGMKDLGANPDMFVARTTYRFDPATKHLTDVGPPANAPSHFMFVFGGDHIVMELLELIDCPEFAAAWVRLCDTFGRRLPGSRYFQTRITAYAAANSGDVALRDQALELFRGELKFQDGEHFAANLPVVEGPQAVGRQIEAPGASSFTPMTATPEAAQWALNLMTATEHFRRFRAGVATR